MTAGDKLAFFADAVLANPSSALLYLGVLACAAAALVRWRKSGGREAFLVVWLAGCGAAMLAAGFAPTPLWPQYFFGPAPFFILALLAGARIFLTRAGWAWALAGAALLAGAAVGAPAAELWQDLRGLANPPGWTVTQYARLAQEIGAKVPCAGTCKVLALAPVLPLDAGLDTYPMFAVGTVSWRTAPLLSAERRAGYGIIAPEDLAGFLAGDPPAAVITGSEARYDGFTPYDPVGLDLPLEAYAEQNGYVPVPLAQRFAPYQDITLWVKPDL